MLTTGLHTVADISCVDCGDVLGWKYVCTYASSFFLRLYSSEMIELAVAYKGGSASIVGTWIYVILKEEAYEESQKYKVGKFILEKAKIGKDSLWE